MFSGILGSERLLTSHVGSFPLQHSWDNVERIAGDLAKIGIDLPPYPQMRSFIDMYLEPLVEAGLLVKKGSSTYHADPKKLLDSRPPRVVAPEAELAARLRSRLGFRWMRGPATGPFTLASRVYVSEGQGLSATALANRDLVTGFFAEYVRGVVESLVSLGYDFIVIDEPMLANIVGRRVLLYGYSPEDVLETYHRILGPAKGRLRGTHVCGRLPHRLPEILAESPDLDVLNHEFADSRANLEIEWRRILEASGKTLSPGILSSKKPVVETVEQAEQLLEAVASKAGWENINIVSADCGFAALSSSAGPEEAYRIGLEKLGVLVELARRRA